MVEIEVPLTISKTADMRFGNIIPGTSASIARMVNNGSITMMGTATHAGGTFGQASFEVTGPPNRWITFNFGAPSILLTNGAGQVMRVERFKPFGYQRISAQGKRQLRASADLLVGANQPPGFYTRRKVQRHHRFSIIPSTRFRPCQSHSDGGDVLRVVPGPHFSLITDSLVSRRN